MTPTRTISVGLGVAALLGGTVLLTGSAAGAQESDTLRLIAVTTEFSEVEPAAVGDGFAFGGDLYALRGGGHAAEGSRRQPVGRFGVSCVITSIEEGEANCTGAVNLDQPRRGDDGQITLQALLSDDSEDAAPELARGRDDRDRGEEWAITGGTDDFDNAGGTMTVRDISDEAALLTFEFAD